LALVVETLDLEPDGPLRALNTVDFERFCDRVAERAAARGLTEDKLTEILGDEG
jgi:hypothetical protein